MKSKGENIRLAFDIGYRLSLLDIFFSSISNQRISDDRIETTINYIRKELDSIAIYFKSLFDETLPDYSVDCQDDIKEVLSEIHHKSGTMIHVHHFGMVESAYKLGEILALTEFYPPKQELVTPFIKRIEELATELKIKSKELDGDLKKITSLDDEERAKARWSLLEIIRGKDYKTIFNDIFKGLQIEAGFTGIKVKKKW